MLAHLTPVPVQNVELLLVEPEDPWADELEALIGDAFGRNCRIDRARTGEQAVAMLQNAEYHVVLGDADLPEMSGVELFRQARRLRPDAVRVLIAHELTRPRLVESINQARVYAYLPRPWTAVSVERCIRSALGWRHNGRAMRLLLEEQRRAHIALIESLAALERTQQQMIHVERLATVGRLATGIVHEVRNQLTALLGIFSVLRHGGGPAAGLATDGYNLVKQLTAQIQSIQAFARAGGWAYDMTDVTVTELLRQISELYELESGQPGLLIGGHPQVRERRLHVDVAKLAHAVLAVIREGQDTHGHGVRLRADLDGDAIVLRFALAATSAATTPARVKGANDPLRAVAQMIVDAHGGSIDVHPVDREREFAEVRIPAT